MKRVYKFSLITYLSEDNIKKVIRDKKYDIRRCCYILHDQDENENHFHILLYTYNAHTFSSIRKWFSGFKGNTLCQEIKDDILAYEYLTHMNEVDKVKYDERNIVKYNWKDFDDIELDRSGYDILNDMLNRVPLRIIAKKYGKDFIYHYTAFRALYDDIVYISAESLDIEQQEFLKK